MDPQYDLAEYVPLCEALVGLGSMGQPKGLSDRNFELCCVDGPVEPLELPDSGFRIIGNDLRAAPLLRLGLDSIWISQPAVVLQRV